MGLIDKAKFWKKDSGDMDDFGDLGDFGLDKESEGAGLGGGLDTAGHDDTGLGGAGTGGFSDIPPPGAEGVGGGMHDLPHDLPDTEEVQPSAETARLGGDMGMSPRGQSVHPAAQTYQSQNRGYQQPVQQSFPQQGLSSDMAKDIEIIHAKLDSIKSSLDAINQRLATLERIASGDQQRNRYTW
ncbi:hypothetical protein KY362_05605 [Candidatus Woesearchaeota archaeon]|nr:hypothetical protein [Candidatus Woesearchaeota archaeon]